MPMGLVMQANALFAALLIFVVLTCVTPSIGDGYGYGSSHGYGGHGSHGDEASYGGGGSYAGGGAGSYAGATVRLGGGGPYDGSNDRFGGGVGSNGGTTVRFGGEGSYDRSNDRFSRGVGLGGPTTVGFGGGGPFGDLSGRFDDVGRANGKIRSGDGGMTDGSSKGHKDRINDIKSKSVGTRGEPHGNNGDRGTLREHRPDIGDGDGAGGAGGENSITGFNQNVWPLTAQAVNPSALVNENTSPCRNGLNQTQSNGLRKLGGGQGRQIGTTLIRIGLRARC